jgi:predicted GNAT family N-acyltransferase
MTSAVASIGVTLADAPRGSPLYGEALRLREALLRKPLGLTVTDEELADDARRRHFCALANGAVIATVSMRPLGAHTLQLRQMAVAPEWRGKGVGARLLAHAEAWARSQEYAFIILNARIGAEGFYAKHGYVAQGEPFEENTIPHIRMTKRIWEEQQR